VSGQSYDQRGRPTNDRAAVAVARHFAHGDDRSKRPISRALKDAARGGCAAMAAVLRAESGS
jgi:hypothetical protein